MAGRPKRESGPHFSIFGRQGPEETAKTVISVGGHFIPQDVIDDINFDGFIQGIPHVPGQLQITIEKNYFSPERAMGTLQIDKSTSDHKMQIHLQGYNPNSPIDNEAFVILMTSGKAYVTTPGALDEAQLMNKEQMNGVFVLVQSLRNAASNTPTHHDESEESIQEALSFLNTYAARAERLYYQS